jgi:hypothetical protein
MGQRNADPWDRCHSRARIGNALVRFELCPALSDDLDAAALPTLDTIRLSPVHPTGDR